MEIKIVVMITDFNLNPPPGLSKYCVGKDRGGKIYAPIWFRESHIPSAGSIWWIRRASSNSWILDHPVVNHKYMEGLEIGDRRISAGRDLILKAENDIHLYSSENTIYSHSNIDMQENKITNLALPTNDSDAANKAYVDAIFGGGLYASSHGGADEVYSNLEDDDYTSASHVNTIDLTDGDDCSSHKYDDRYYTETDAKYSQLGHNHNIAVSGLSDVNFTSLRNGDFLIYDNGDWVNSKKAPAHSADNGVTPQIANLVFGTNDPPDPTTVPEGTLWVKYTE